MGAGRRRPRRHQLCPNHFHHTLKRCIRRRILVVSRLNRCRAASGLRWETRLEMELTVDRGTGYVPADGREPPALGVIPIDAVFTPVRRVNYSVEPARVGARTDLDRLTLEIQTDGTISPLDALGAAADALIESFSIFTDLAQPGRRGEKPSLATGNVPARAHDMPIEALELSQRTYNCLKRSQIT